MSSENCPDDLVRTREAGRIAQMFNSISGRYDLMNRLMTAGQDGRWRRLAADTARLRPGDRALDVATGTGDMALELAERVGPKGEILGVDIAEAMLEVARLKTRHLPVRYEHSDVHDLMHEDEFDACTVAFGFRNFSDRRIALEQMTRALKPGGRLVILELVPAQSCIAPVARLYEKGVLPILGALIAGNREAYRYLPQSIAASPTVSEIARLLSSAGLIDVKPRTLNLGTVAIVSGLKPPAASGVSP